MDIKWKAFGFPWPSFRVELFGGPFDGEIRNVAELETRLSLPVFQTTMDQPTVSRSNHVTSIAIYVLSVKNAGWSYCFLRSVPAHKAITDDVPTEM